MYTFIPEAKTWFDAGKDCENKSYDLANFKPTKEDTFFIERDFPVWIGLYKYGKD